MVTVPIVSRHDGFTLPVFAVAANGPVQGGVIVLQEIFGITPHIEEICGVFASAGYETLAPALFERTAPGLNVAPDAAGVVRGRQAVAATPWPQVAADIQACVNASPKPCFVAGFCWGGAGAWVAAGACEGLSAASCFYGRQIADLLDTPPRVPVMLHYGARDAAIPPENVARVRAAAAHAPLYMYDAGHGFCRKGSHDHDEPARELALSRTLDWFARWR